MGIAANSQTGAAEDGVRQTLSSALGLANDAGARPATHIRIEPGRRSLRSDLAELWEARELLILLTWRDIKVRYKQAVLGAAWAILQPFLTMVVFTVFFGKLARVPSDGVPYAVFSYAALLPWTFFANSVTDAAGSLVASSSLVTKVYFPRMAIPIASVAAGLVDFSIAAVILGGLMAYYGIGVGLGALAMVALVPFMTVLTLGVGTWAAALNVKYRDVRYALPFAMQLWMFATPVIYPISIVPIRWRWLLALNPMTGIIAGFRAALFGRPQDWHSLTASFVLTTVILVGATFSFRRMERSFADII